MCAGVLRGGGVLDFRLPYGLSKNYLLKFLRK